MTAIMGPSGAGKTTLLKILSGRYHGNYAGKISYDNKNMKKGSLSKLSAYIHQDDLHHPYLTVRESIAFHAKMRGVVNVDRDIEELGLKHIENNLTGDSVKGISAGERKRLSIAKEIVSRPEILFLDEPTSGLDTLTALNLVKYLKTMCETGTVVATIHQPSSDIFFCFDDLYLLKGGRCVYYGEVRNAIRFFDSYGFHCPSLTNPADFIFTHCLPFIKESDFRSDDSRVTTAAHTNKNLSNNKNPDISECEKDLNEETKGESYERPILEYSRDQDHAIRGTTTLEKFTTLLKRNLKSITRNNMRGFARIGQSLFTSLILGLVFFKIGENPPEVRMRSAFGVLYFICLNLLFNASIGSVYEMFSEIDISARE
jgi:ABC-type multidrug transport system ATPase subunit